jgi:pyruvate,orthophosphate dikinase
VQELAARFGGIPEEPVEQVVRCVEAVFRSWESPRAQVFRQREGIDGTMGTAATVQAMVFGNLDDHSGTGVVFTRDPATGANEPFGDYLARAQGEDVVAGTHAVSGLARLREQMPAVYDELLKALRVLERHYRDMCDVEFTISSGKLYILQTRIGRRSPLAAVRIAVDMAEDPEFPLSRAEAAARIDDGVLQQLAAQRSVKPEAVAVASGLAASPGVGSGLLCCDADRAAALAESDTPVVLARNETSPEDVHGMIGAAAIVTTLGGVASHAAVVARSWAIPAICSLAGARVEEGGLRLSDRFIPEGTTVTVDGSRGLLYEGDCCAPGVEEIPELRIIREWAREPLFRGGEEEATAEASLLDVVRTIQLKGLCSPERAAAALGAATRQVEALIAANEGLFKPTPRGLALTPEGRTWLSARLQEERTSIDSAAMDACYERFTPLNEQFKRLVSDWQRSSAHGAGEDRFAALVRDMRDLHEAFLPVVDTAGAVAPRLARYAARFANALAALATGDVSMLASPLKDSYHTVWFEFHEELITLSGRDRASEET